MTFLDYAPDSIPGIDAARAEFLEVTGGFLDLAQTESERLARLEFAREDLVRIAAAHDVDPDILGATLLIDSTTSYVSKVEWPWIDETGAPAAGNPVEPATNDWIACPSCGQQIPHQFSQCVGCGTASPAHDSYPDQDDIPDVTASAYDWSQDRSAFGSGSFQEFHRAEMELGAVSGPSDPHVASQGQREPNETPLEAREGATALVFWEDDLFGRTMSGMTCEITQADTQYVWEVYDTSGSRITSGTAPSNQLARQECELAALRHGWGPGAYAASRQEFGEAVRGEVSRFLQVLDQES